MDWSLMWAIRCMHEAQVHQQSSFVTLTYDDEHLPADGRLSPPEAKQFIRRLVKRTGSPVRFFLGGEYGTFGRPHYHALLFGVDFPDRVLYKRGAAGSDMYRSRVLEELWPLGFSTIGSVTFASASYVARYCLKKSGFKEGQFVRMSRRPGLGSAWLRRFASDVYPRGRVVIEGKEVKPPRYYDMWLKSLRPLDYEAVRQSRVRAAVERGPVVPARLRDRETILVSKLDQSQRSL